jgi:ribonuclease HII
MTTSAMRTATTTLRRSARLRSIAPKATAIPDPNFRSSSSSPLSSFSRPLTNTNKRQRRSKLTATATTSDQPDKIVAERIVKKTKTKAKKKNNDKFLSNDDEISCLPRNEEMSILSSSTSSKIQFVVGVDEAGRGPLAGPVVVAAAMVPIDINGITDSKKITKEDDREDLYNAIVNSSDVRWAVAVMDAPFIDRVNILQATMRGMAACTSALITGSSVQLEEGDGVNVVKIPKATTEQDGCYVITNNNNDGIDNFPAENYFALVDGNRVPTDMPCESKSIVKGDSKEYAIAAASILAKVTRDRLMRDYDKLYPHFGLQQHKGYPTAAHMQAVKVHGASPIHRRTFRPLKDMTFDKDGKVLDLKKKEK